MIIENNSERVGVERERGSVHRQTERQRGTEGEVEKGRDRKSETEIQIDRERKREI